MSTIGGVGSWPPPQPYTPPSFSQLDSNDDGSVSLQELEADAPNSASGAAPGATQQQAEALFKTIDSNGDGAISSDEFSSSSSRSRTSGSRRPLQRNCWPADSHQAAARVAPAACIMAATITMAAARAMRRRGRAAAAPRPTPPTATTMRMTRCRCCRPSSARRLPIRATRTPARAAATARATRRTLLIAANNAYGSTSSAGDLWSSLSSVLQDAA